MTSCPLFELVSESDGYFSLVRISNCCGNCSHWDWYDQWCHKEEQLSGSDGDAGDRI
jgi:hypothetical protein